MQLAGVSMLLTRSAVGMVEQAPGGFVVSGLALVEEGACAFSPMDA